MKPSWMPENPYPKIDNPGTSSTAWYGEGLHVGFNEGSIETAKAVLEYLLAHGNKQQELHRVSFSCGPLHRDYIQQMLKEIEN